MSAHAFLPPPLPLLLPVLLAASLCLAVPVLPVLFALAPGGGRARLAAVDMVSIAGPADRDPCPATRALIDNQTEQNPASPRGGESASLVFRDNLVYQDLWMVAYARVSSIEGPEWHLRALTSSPFLAEGYPTTAKDSGRLSPHVRHDGRI